jgi:pilus assembly protein Flp/PilA
MRIICFLKGLYADRTAATAIEYGLIVTLIVIAMMASLNSVANSTNDMWSTVNTKITTADD